jgi:hypothetical protein
MIKDKCLLALTVSTLNACSFISFSDSLPLAQAAIFGFERDPISQSEFDSKEYSFIAVYFKKSPLYTFSLSKVTGTSMKWVGSDGQIIFTDNGVVTKTLGLDHDYQLLDRVPFDFNTIERGIDDTFFVKYANPSAIFLYESTLMFVASESVNLQFQTVNARKYKEIVYIKDLNLNIENFYWVNDQGVTIKAIQQLNPKMPEMTFEFFYKY